MKPTTKHDISELEQLSDIAKILANETSKERTWIYLIGDLGAGKTTFSQHFIAAAGFADRVTSPTYAIMNDYETSLSHIIHCDLYRLCDPEELDELGIIELAEERKSTVLVEWPSKGKGILPPADIILEFELFTKNKRTLTITNNANS
ncbi:MAG: tRNA (adenosine(37)-N6)-threonylcarbamoyltransferase complex ATPase subunit type 1 TsaE [Gammaproteobacteria bacterium]|nr:tRNA (adenosine(37)-N6)-threonylcarbamoyltransferase complex ATPase subunit type 1 TsaE [Gammaproteobacteria bacterium]